MPEPAGNTAAAFGGLLDALREAADAHSATADEVADEIDVVASFRYLLHLVSAGIDFHLEGDPDRPEFVKILSPTRKFGGCNPDAIYYFALIRGDRSYRITGKKGKECYLSFTIQGRTDEDNAGVISDPVLADVNDRGLTIAPDGSFEVILSPDEHPGNWIQLQPNASCIITRHYFEQERCAVIDPDIQVQLHIEPLEAPPLRPQLTDAVMAQRIKATTAFIRNAVNPIDRSIPMPFVSWVPNELPEPFIFRMGEQVGWGAVDNAYSMAPFRLGPEEALLMEGRFPDCAFANVMLWNRLMQSFEYRDRRVSLNRKQTVLEPNGSYRIVIAHRDPGVPNWLDTDGHTEGLIFWRFLLPAGTPTKPECTVVPFSAVPR